MKIYYKALPSLKRFLLLFFSLFKTESHFSQQWLAAPAAPCPSRAQDQALQAVCLWAMAFCKTPGRQHRHLPRNVGMQSAFSPARCQSSDYIPSQPRCALFLHICSSQSPALSVAFLRNTWFIQHGESFCWEGCNAPACAKRQDDNW